VDVPHSNQAVVALPLGVTLPLSTAAVEVTPVASDVARLGPEEVEVVEVVERVVKLCTSPRVVPALLLAATRK
jgi:hypothetical protein